MAHHRVVRPDPQEEQAKIRQLAAQFLPHDDKFTYDGGYECHKCGFTGAWSDCEQHLCLEKLRFRDFFALAKYRLFKRLQSKQRSANLTLNKERS